VDKSIRVLLEKDGKPFGGPVTFHGPAKLLAIGNPWDDVYVIVDGRRGTDDEDFDEVVLIVEPKP
jgi:hypothetical protein